MTNETTAPLGAQAWSGARGDHWRTHLAGMEATFAPVDEPLLDALRLDAPCRIADLGCGGGGATLAIARRAPPGSVVHGLDISPSLVELARARPGPAGRAVTFEVADLMTSPAPATPHDRLASRFGVMFFDDPAAAFANLARWLAPGGRFAFAVWGHPADNAWLATVREVVATVVDVPSPAPGAPGPFRYADVAPLLALLERSGLGDLDVHTWRGALPIGGQRSAAEAASFALAAFSSFAELLAAAGDRALGAAQEALTGRFASHQRDGAVWL